MNSVSKHFTVTMVKSLQLFHLEGHIFYSVSFTYKGELAQLGEGQEEINSIQGIAAVITNGPRSPLSAAV